MTWPLWNICVTNDHRYFPLVVNTSQFFPHSWLITRFVTRLTRRVPLVEQELLTLPEHLSSPPVFSWVRVTLSLDLCVCFVDCCLPFSNFSFGHCVVCSSSFGHCVFCSSSFGHCVVCSSSFDHCVVCSSSISRFWLPLWYLQTLLVGM